MRMFPHGFDLGWFDPPTLILLIQTCKRYHTLVRKHMCGLEYGRHLSVSALEHLRKAFVTNHKICWSGSKNETDTGWLLFREKVATDRTWGNFPSSSPFDDRGWGATPIRNLLRATLASKTIKEVWSLTAFAEKRCGGPRRATRPITFEVCSAKRCWFFFSMLIAMQPGFVGLRYS